MPRYHILLFLLLTLSPLAYSTGLVWVRMSSSQRVTARFESVDKENVTRYGISLELQVTEQFKEFVLPMPPQATGAAPGAAPVFPYSIQMFKFKYGEFIGEKFENIAPVQTKDIWTHKTVTDRVGISIFTSLRFECLPGFYGSNCQFYCAPGEECAEDQCGKIKCEKDFRCEFDGKSSRCVCALGEICEKNQIIKQMEKSINFLFILIIILLLSLIFVVIFFVKIVFSLPKNRKICAPISSSMPEKFQILTPEHLIFEKL